MGKDTVAGLQPIRYYSTVTERSIDWLWYPYIPFGKITVVQGDPGDGKTTFILNIASLLSKGFPMPESSIAFSGTAIYQSAEDSMEDTIKPRLLSAGADCTKIAFIDDAECGLTVNGARIESAIIETGARLLVLDPLQAYLGESYEMNRADGIRPMMKQLTTVANRTGCAIVIIGHMNKASSAKGIYRGLGSIDITAAARSVLLVGRVGSNSSIRAMAQIKNSLAEEGAPIAFEILDNAAVRWIGHYDISVDELLNGCGTPPDESKVNQAAEKLKELLTHDMVPCKQIYKILSKQDVGKRSVDKAKKALGIKSIKRADGWYWSL